MVGSGELGWCRRTWLGAEEMVGSGYGEMPRSCGCPTYIVKNFWGDGCGVIWLGGVA